MSKSEFRTTYQIKSLTLLLSSAEGIDLDDIRGKRFEITAALNGLVFDNEGDLPAYFYALCNLQLGSGAQPASSDVVLRWSGNQALVGEDDGDPRQSVLSRLVFELEISEDAEAFEDLPLIIKGFNAASDAPAAFELPDFDADEGPAIVVKDKDGGLVGITVRELASAGGGGSVPPALEALEDILVVDDDGELVVDEDGPVYDFS